MATVLLQDANFLLLDEPTNHLDIYAKDVLLNALRSYKGTLLFVSHDHDFINGLATRIIELTPDGACSYQGNYSSYQQHQKEREQLNLVNNTTAKKATKPVAAAKEAPKKNDDPRKQIQKLEQTIDRLEKQVAKQEELFAAITWGTPEYDAAHARLVELKKELAVTVSAWEEALRPTTL
jgi:ATP-binding cassette subfamily F protein 3